MLSNVKAYREEEKTRYVRETKLEWYESCYSFHVQGPFSAEGSTGSVSFQVREMHSHGETPAFRNSWMWML